MIKKLIRKVAKVIVDLTMDDTRTTDYNKYDNYDKLQDIYIDFNVNAFDMFILLYKEICKMTGVTISYDTNTDKFILHTYRITDIMKIEDSIQIHETVDVYNK